MSKQAVVKGAAFIYVETVISMIAGYLFWIIMSKITAPDVIGISSAIISFATIFATVGGLGAYLGVQRFLGKSFSEKKLEDVKLFVKASFLLTIVGLTICVIFIYSANNWINQIIYFPFELSIVAIVFIISSAIMTLFRYIIISSLKTKILPTAMILSNVGRIAIATILVMLGSGAFGILTGFTMFPLIASIIFSIVVIGFTASNSQHSDTSIGKSIKMILHASVPSWIPFSIYTIGIHLGPIVVFGSHGASQAGVYSMAFFIATAISAGSSALFSIAYPKLSSMYDGRKRFAWRTIELSLIISIPFSISLIFYSSDIMQLIGDDYSDGSAPLKILLITMTAIIVSAGINILVYSYGNYRQVLLIGLASNVPRVILYLILVPIYESEGAAISYSLGSIIGLVASVIISSRIGMRVNWKHIAIIFLIPTAVGLVLGYLEVNYIVGIPSVVILSYLVLLKLRIIGKDDINDLLQAFPQRVTSRVTILWSKTRRIFGKS